MRRVPNAGVTVSTDLHVREDTLVTCTLYPDSAYPRMTVQFGEPRVLTLYMTAADLDMFIDVLTDAQKALADGRPVTVKTA